MSGKIDKLIIDRRKKTIVIVDYKTGKSYARWTHDSKLHRYQKQLYLYKTLIEKSRTWQGYRVVGAYLEFVEPDETDTIQELHITFNDADQRQSERLAQAIWGHIQDLDIPDTNRYTSDLKGIEAFENALLKNTEI